MVAVTQSRTGFKKKITKKRIDREGNEQASFMYWLHATHRDIYPYCFHVPNGGARSAATGAQLKREGVKKGVPDLFFEIPRGGFHGLRVEFKATPPHNSALSKEQKQWIERLSQQGYCAKVCKGLAELKAVFSDYLALPEFGG